MSRSQLLVGRFKSVTVLHNVSKVQTRKFSRHKTGTFERALLWLTVGFIPLQEHVPSIGGFSIIWLIFASVGAYVFLKRTTALRTIWLHPLFVSSYVFLFVGVFIESMHRNPAYFEILRIAQMVIGAVLIASLCRDRKGLRIAMLGLVVGGIWVSVTSGLPAFGVLSSAHVSNFQEATIARGAAAEASLVEISVNTVAAAAARGAIVAIVFALTGARRSGRYFYWSVAAICVLGVFVTLSRSGVVNVVLSTGAVLFAAGVKNRRSIIAVTFVVAIAGLVVPESVWYRMSFSTETTEGRMEGRARVYTAAIEELPEYVWLGVGVGNFWGLWGLHSDFGGQGVVGSHNGFFQVTIYWGLAGLFALLWLIWRAYRCLPKHNGKDPLALCLLGVSVSLMMMLLAQHSVYSKEFAVGLGLLAGSHRWIWRRNSFLARRRDLIVTH